MVQYIRVFDLQGYIDTLSELISKTKLNSETSAPCSIILSNFGNMSLNAVYFDEIKGNSIVSDIMLMVRRLSSVGVDVYVVGYDGMVSYYLDEVVNV